MSSLPQVATIARVTGDDEERDDTVDVAAELVASGLPEGELDQVGVGPGSPGPADTNGQVLS